jgi:hypothetical protein
MQEFETIIAHAINAQNCFGIDSARHSLIIATMSQAENQSLGDQTKAANGDLDVSLGAQQLPEAIASPCAVALRKPRPTLDELLKGYMKVQRRSEKATPEVLRKTFVDVGPLFTLLSINDNQLLYGRRGTGKTHVLNYLASIRREADDVAVYIDLSNLGSSGSVYADANRALPERATALLVDALLAIHDELLSVVLASDNVDLSRLGPLLDELATTATTVKVVGAVEQQTSIQSKDSDQRSAGITVSIAPKPPSATISASSSSATEETSAVSQKRTGTERYVLNFGAVSSSIERIAAALVPHRLWIILDEWSNLPLDLQPYLADLIRRTLFHLSGVTVKIAAIEFRSRFAIPEPNNTYIGVEVGADMSAGANLDDIMVFDNDVERASAFHRQLIYNHLKESGLFAEDTVRDAKELVRLTFTQDNAFSELVRAAEGVPRDAIHILSLAAQYSGNERISIPTVRKAAKNWYQTGKANNLRSREAANQLLEWIKEKVIQHRKARAFLLKSQTSHPLIDELFDARVIHLIKRGVSSNETPGVRYDVYKLDYGCYVDLMSTGSAPLGLFEVEEAVGASSYYSAARKSLK